MKVTSIAGALLGGVAGALVWGVIARFMEFEIGFVAWGVGIAVGFLSAAFGGKGLHNGALCALLALFAIFAGKILAVKWSATPEEFLSFVAKEGKFADLSDAERRKVAEQAASEFTWNDAVVGARESLGAIDLLFGFLGVATAFRLGAGSGKQEGEATPDEPEPSGAGPPGEYSEPEPPAAEPSAGTSEPEPPAAEPPAGQGERDQASDK